MVKKVFKISAFIITIPIFIFIIFLLTLTITDFKPNIVEPLNIKSNNNEHIKKNTVFSISTFNIGYCGMDMEQDFFMDGGTGSRSTSKEKTIDNLKGVTDFLFNEKSDIILLQEVDVNSTRSFKVNEYDYITKTLFNYSSVFAYNYKVLWVPIPITKPHGNVKSGLLTLSKFSTSSSSRYQYPGSESWPRQLAELDRCFIESRIPVQDGKELILINSHLSAFDKGGIIRKLQLGFLKDYIEKEFRKGNYVIVGGDFNHVIPGTDPSKFKATESWPQWLQKLPEDFRPMDFKWAADTNIPTSRTAAFPYKKDVNFLVTIDGFLVSSNVDINKVTGHSLDFKYTDHNPVTGYFILK